MRSNVGSVDVDNEVSTVDVIKVHASTPEGSRSVRSSSRDRGHDVINIFFLELRTRAYEDAKDGWGACSVPETGFLQHAREAELACHWIAPREFEDAPVWGSHFESLKKCKKSGPDEDKRMAHTHAVWASATNGRKIQTKETMCLVSAWDGWSKNC